MTDSELTMSEMQFFLKLANGDSIPAVPPHIVSTSRVKDKLGDGVIKIENGHYKLGEVPPDLIINLRGGVVKRREG